MTKEAWTERSPVRKGILAGRNVRRSWNRVLVALAVMAGLTLASVFLFLQYSAVGMRESMADSLRQSVEQRKLNIDFRLGSIQQIDRNLVTAVWPHVCSGAARNEQYREYNELNSILSVYEQNENLSNIRLYVPDEKFYSNQGGTFYPLSALAGDSGSEALLQKPGMVWTEPQLVRLRDRTGVQRSPRYVLTCVHSMRQRTDYGSLACVLMLDVEIADFRELLSTEVYEDQYGYIVNGAGSCMAAADESRLGTAVIPPAVMAGIRESGVGWTEADRRVYVYDKLEYGDWYVVMDYPAEILSSSSSPEARTLRTMTLIVALITLTVFFVLAYYYSMHVTLARINASLDALNTGQEKDLEQTARSRNVLHALERNADQMVLTVKELMEHRYRDRLELAETQMQSLQAQIKPHFLYNTLDIIKWMIVGDKTDDAVWMVNALSKYLRQSINKGPAVIPLHQELTLSRTYLAIMQKRFENRFTVNFEVEEEAESCLIPKLSLQPLLENGLLHGILYSDKPEKELTVRAWVADGSLYVEVEDNGDGMTGEQCEALRRGEGGYGFANVRKRLSLFSEGQARVEIHSRKGFGTCIAIELTARREGQENGENASGPGVRMSE